MGLESMIRAIYWCCILDIKYIQFKCPGDCAPVSVGSEVLAGNIQIPIFNRKSLVLSLDVWDLFYNSFSTLF